MGIYARRNLVIANFGPNVLLTQPLTNGQILVYDAQLGSFINSNEAAPSSSVIKVADIPSRNALTNLTDGQFVFVQDTGTGSHEYALYMWNANSQTWTTISTQNSAEVDANTFSYILNYNSPTIIPLSYISAGHRSVEVTIEVTTAFNGTGAGSSLLTIGDESNSPTSHSNLMDETMNDLSQVQNYDSSGNFVYPGTSDTLVYAYFTPGTSTVGQATIILSYV